MIKRIYSIEFIRIVLVFAILWLHSLLSCSKLLAEYPFRGAHMNHAVEFFFIIGGFFLYRRIISNRSSCELICKTYWRFLPGLLFAFLLLVCTGPYPFSHIFILLSLTGGSGLAFPFHGPSWFLSVYFLFTCLAVGLFRYNSKLGWTVLGVLVYAGLMLHEHGQVLAGGHNGQHINVMDTYYNIIGVFCSRGICSMGIGMMTAFFALKINPLKKNGFRLFCTVFELYALIHFFIYLFGKSSYGYIEIQVLFALLLISMSNSLGYLSSLMNKVSSIPAVSRYCFSIYIMHEVLLKWRTWFLPELKYIDGAIFIVGGGIVLGVLEYHLIEKFLVPKLILYFKK